jgi:rRNA-processing protein FCF1
MESYGNSRVSVLLDTNILLLPAKHKIDVFAEIERLIIEPHEVLTLSGIVSELEGLVGCGRDGLAAKAGLDIIREKKVRVLESVGVVDDAIVDFAGGNHTIVATNDRELMGRLRGKAAGLLYMRGKNRLELT